MAGIDITIVTYRGTGPLTTDLLGGHVKLGLNVLAPAMSMLKAGSLKALAVLASKRSSHLPDVPTSAEAGLPGFEVRVELRAAGARRHARSRSSTSSIARCAPASTPPRSAPASPPTAATRLPSSPEEYRADIEREDGRWGALIRKLNLKVE